VTVIKQFTSTPFLFESFSLAQCHCPAFAVKLHTMKGLVSRAIDIWSGNHGAPFFQPRGPEKRGNPSRCEVRLIKWTGPREQTGPLWTPARRAGRGKKKGRSQSLWAATTQTLPLTCWRRLLHNAALVMVTAEKRNG